MKKIFITGGGGYVGSVLSDYLVTKNYEGSYVLYQKIKRQNRLYQMLGNVI